MYESSVLVLLRSQNVFALKILKVLSAFHFISLALKPEFPATYAREGVNDTYTQC